MARPKLEINEREVENYAKLGASNVEIAGMVGCDEGTIRGRFSEILIKARSTRKIKLREMQWKLAEKGNLGMLIWLGKNELGQADKIETKSDIAIEDKKAERLEEVKRLLESEFGK